jgi:branched-chain amino acid aminotransferase
MAGWVWVDGTLQPRETPALRADDSAYMEGRGCYTTALVRRGRARFEERHVARLVRAARELRLGELDPERVRCALRELATAEFGDGEGIVRVSASRDGDGELHVVGIPRPLGEQRETWSAAIIALRHSAEGLDKGLKVTSRLAMALAGDAANELGVDEAILLDSSGQLVEGSRSNIFVAAGDAALATPPISAGGVAGVTRAVVLERVAGIEERAVSEAELRAASEIIAVNAVRGACPIVSLDGKPVGDGRPGPWVARLQAALAKDD